MKTLILLRHAKAEAHGAKRGDHDRGLAERGVKDSAAMGAYIAAHGPAPDLILCSDARRARETMEGVLGALRPAPAIEMDAGLYLAESQAILRRIRKIRDDFATVMIVGHNPGMEDLARALIRRPVAPARMDAFLRLEGKFPTGGMAVFTFGLDSWAFIDVGLGTLDAFTVPRDLAKA